MPRVKAHCCPEAGVPVTLPPPTPPTAPAGSPAVNPSPPQTLPLLACQRAAPIGRCCCPDHQWQGYSLLEGPAMTPYYCVVRTRVGLQLCVQWRSQKHDSGVLQGARYFSFFDDNEHAVAGRMVTH